MSSMWYVQPRSQGWSSRNSGWRPQVPGAWEAGEALTEPTYAHMAAIVGPLLDFLGGHLVRALPRAASCLPALATCAGPTVLPGLGSAIHSDPHPKPGFGLPL